MKLNKATVVPAIYVADAGPMVIGTAMEKRWPKKDDRSRKKIPQTPKAKHLDLPT